MAGVGAKTVPAGCSGFRRDLLATLHWSVASIFHRMAGAGGLEPPHGGTKNRCLTNLATPQYLPSCERSTSDHPYQLGYAPITHLLRSRPRIALTNLATPQRFPSCERPTSDHPCQPGDDQRTSHRNRLTGFRRPSATACGNGSRRAGANQIGRPRRNTQRITEPAHPGQGAIHTIAKVP